MLAKTSKVFHIKNSYKRLRKLVVLEFNWKITFNSKYCNYVKYITLHVTSSITVGILTVYQATIHNKGTKYPPPDGMGTSNHGLLHPFKGPKAVANGLTCIKNVLCSVATGKNLK